MIDSVNNNRGYYEYNKINTNMGAGMDSHEKFALGYESTDKDSTKKEDKKSVKDTDGVVVEFSNQAKAKQDGLGNGRENAAGAEDAFDMEQTIESAKGFIGNFIKAVSDLWNGFKQALVQFWNSDSETQKTAPSEENADIVDSVGEEILGESDGALGAILEVEGTIEREETAPELARVAKLPDTLNVDETRRQAEELFANGHYVKNSDLLTYYDRSGKFVQLSGTDKNRILHGDGRGGRLI